MTEPKVYCFIICRKEHEKCEFDVHEVYAIDILVSTGDGKAKEKDTRTTVYKRTPNMYSFKNENL